jgi:hypothetical protein
MAEEPPASEESPNFKDELEATRSLLKSAFPNGMNVASRELQVLVRVIAEAIPELRDSPLAMGMFICASLNISYLVFVSECYFMMQPPTEQDLVDMETMRQYLLIHGYEAWRETAEREEKARNRPYRPYPWEC